MAGFLLGRRGFHESPPQTEVSYKLPSLQEFDQGVQALVDANSPPSNPSPQNLPSFNAVSKPQLHSFQTYQAQEEPLPAASSPYASAPADHHAGCASSFSSSSLCHTPRTPYATLLPHSAPEPSPEELCPRAQPKQQGKHCTKPYTVEEGDFIIYHRHDKNRTWEDLQSKFESIFGSEPRRSPAGLKAHYYRMNAIVPCWDSQGYLIFEDENTVEPKTREINSTEKERDKANAAPLGLAQRYPERGMNYAWVGHEDQIAMSDWGKTTPLRLTKKHANKRIQQVRERRERRKRMEEQGAVDMQHRKLQKCAKCNGTGQSISNASPYPVKLDVRDNKCGRQGHWGRTLPAGGKLGEKSPNDRAPASEASDDSDDELFQGVDMDALANRGKGVYHCPKHERCNKGGVDKDGNLVAFKRNSSFLIHCNRHLKPFRCEEEHCPNPPKKRKFARREQLERHKKNVSHVTPSPGRRRASRRTLV